jgi:hypothetical protein
VRGRGKDGASLAVRDDHRQPAAAHAGEEDRRRLGQFDQRETCFELLDAVALEARPGVGARDHVLEHAHHLAAVADAEGKGVRACEEGRKDLAGAFVEENRLRPALTRSEDIAVGKAAAGDGALEPGERDAAGENVAHVYVDGGKAGTIESGGHLDVPVDALFAQNRHPRSAPV